MDEREVSPGSRTTPPGAARPDTGWGKARRVTGLLLSLSIMAAGVVVMRTGGSQEASAAICNDTVPLGALAPAIPEWCKDPLVAGLDTHAEGANSWVDDFDHGQTHAALNGAYVSGDLGLTDSIFFQHNNHWMVDIQGPGKGAAWMRPNRSFAAENGTLVVETEVAPSIATYNTSTLGDFWPEIVVTSAPAPTFSRPDALYLYDEFANNWTFGCRLQRDGSPICALFNNSAGGAGSGGRVWEASWFQCAGSISCSGGATWAAPGAWKTCSNSDDPDAICRNKFRLELTNDSFTLYVNGQRYFQQKGLPSLNNLLAQPLYVYNGSVVYQFGSGVLRAHWDHLAVNPESSGGSTPPPPTQTTAVPTATPTNTPTPTPTVSNLPPCRVAVQQFVRGKWRTIRYENMSPEYCAQ